MKRSLKNFEEIEALLSNTNMQSLKGGINRGRGRGLGMFCSTMSCEGGSNIQDGETVDGRPSTAGPIDDSGLRDDVGVTDG